MTRSRWFQPVGPRSKFAVEEQPCNPFLRRRALPLRLERLEDRIAPDGTLSYVAPLGDGPDSLILRLLNTDVVILDQATQSVLASKPLADTTAVAITGAVGEETTLRIDLTLVGSLPFVGGITFSGRSGNDTLVGPAGDWT